MADRARLAVLLGCVAAIVVGAVEWRRDTVDPKQEPPREAKPLAPFEIPPQSINSLAAYEAIVERPLFTPGRRPPVANAPDEHDAADAMNPIADPSGLRLSAILCHADRQTVLIEDQTGETQILHRGDRIGNWRIEEIADDQIVIVAGAQRQSLMLHQFEPLPAQRRTTPVNRRTFRRPTELPVARRAPDDDEGS